MIDQTQLNLKALSGGEFQQLMSKLLPRINPKYAGLVNSGAVEGTAKTRKGTPDIWLKKAKKYLICFEITVDEKKNKLKTDLDKCIELYNKEIEKEYVCVLNYEPQYTWIKPLVELCLEKKIIFTLFHNSKIANELDKANNQDLREAFLNISRDIILSNKNTLNTGEFNNQFSFSVELQEARKLLNENNIKQAKERALAVKLKIENSDSIKEKEELYRIIADSFLYDVQGNHIPQSG